MGRGEGSRLCFAFFFIVLAAAAPYSVICFHAFEGILTHGHLCSLDWIGLNRMRLSSQKEAADIKCSELHVRKMLNRYYRIESLKYHYTAK